MSLCPQCPQWAATPAGHRVMPSPVVSLLHPPMSLLPPCIPFSLSIRDIGTFLDKERARARGRGPMTYRLDARCPLTHPRRTCRRLPERSPP